MSTHLTTANALLALQDEIIFPQRVYRLGVHYYRIVLGGNPFTNQRILVWIAEHLTRWQIRWFLIQLQELDPQAIREFIEFRGLSLSQRRLILVPERTDPL